MKKLTDEEFKGLQLKRNSHVTNRVTAEINKLEVGESLFVEKKEWTLKQKPYGSVGNYNRSKTKKLVFMTTSAGDYIFKRVM